MTDLVIKKGVTTLADAVLHTGAIVLAASNGVQRMIDTSSPILADVLAFIDLVTRRGEMTFTLNRQHASETLALDHFFRHPQTVTGVDDLIVEWTDGSAVTHRWTAAGCAWRAASSPALPMGIATAVTYQVETPGQWAYENSEGGELPQTSTQLQADTQALSVSTAGDSTITLDSDVRERYLRLTVGAGAGAYTRNVFLAVTDREDGNVVDVMVSMPASANPTVKFYDTNTSGTLLHTMPADATEAAVFHLKFVFSATSGEWELWNY